MKVVISAKRLQDEKAINEHIKHRLSFAFSRTRRFIRSIEFILSDIQGPKGGVDKECKVIVEPESSDAIVIVERQSLIAVLPGRAEILFSRERGKSTQLILACAALSTTRRRLLLIFVARSITDLLRLKRIRCFQVRHPVDQCCRYRVPARHQCPGHPSFALPFAARQ